MPRDLQHVGAPEISLQGLPLPGVVRWNTLYLAGATALFSMAFEHRNDKSPFSVLPARPVGAPLGACPSRRQGDELSPVIA